MHNDNEGASGCDSTVIAGLIRELTTTLARAIASELRDSVRETLQDGTTTRYLSLRGAARTARIRTAVVLAAVRLAADHPGHLRSFLRPGKGGKRRFITSGDLDEWMRSGAMGEARQASDRMASGGTP